MKKYYICYILVAITFIFSGNYTYAQNKKENKTSAGDYLSGKKDLNVGFKNDSTSIFIDYFKRTMPKGFQEVTPPRFIITGTNNNFLMGIGGQIKMHTGYGIRNDKDLSGFVPFLIPMTPSAKNDQKFIMDVKYTRLFFRFLATNKKLKGFDAYIEMDFAGNGATIRLRKAYVKYYGFLIGQNVSFFSDAYAVPYSIDPQGANGYSYTREMMLAYSHKIGKRIVVGMAIEYPKVKATFVEGKTEAATQRIPDIPLTLIYNFNEDAKNYLRFSSVFRGLTYYNSMSDKNKTEFAWGVQLTGRQAIAKGLSLYHGTVYGNGIGKYLQDFQMGGLDLIPSFETTMQTSGMLGWHIGADYKISKKFLSSFIFSQAQMFIPNIKNIDYIYKKGNYLSATLCYTPTPSLEIGLEYNWGSRTNVDNNCQTAHRICTQILYKF